MLKVDPNTDKVNSFYIAYTDDESIDLGFKSLRTGLFSPLSLRRPTSVLGPTNIVMTIYPSEGHIITISVRTVSVSISQRWMTSDPAVHRSMSVNVPDYFHRRRVSTNKLIVVTEQLSSCLMHLITLGMYLSPR